MYHRCNSRSSFSLLPFLSLQAEGRRYVREVTGASTTSRTPTATTNSTASTDALGSGNGAGTGSGGGVSGSDWEVKLDQAIKAGLAASSPVLALFTKRIYKVKSVLIELICFSLILLLIFLRLLTQVSPLLLTILLILAFR